MKRTKNRKIVIGPSSFAERDRTSLDRLQAAGFIVVENPYRRKMTKEEIQALLTEDVVGLLAGLEPLDREVLAGSRLRVISRVGAGTTNVDGEAARQLKIRVFSTPYGPTNAVAELTLGALLSLLRWIPLCDRNMHDRRWHRRMGEQIEGKTVAIVGFGRIGRRVAELLVPFRASVIAVDPFAATSGSSSCPLMPLEEAISRADIVTVHASGDACLFDESTFSSMKRGAFLLNASRGSVVSEQALIKALDDGIVAGAWLDTFEVEPYTGPLCSYENVILTPHIGSYTAECRQQMENEAVSNLLKVLTK